MRPRPIDSTPRPGFGSIQAGEVLPLREAGRRLGWGNKTIAQAQRDGLKAVQYGKIKYTTGRAVLEFIERLMNGRPDDNETT